ncbi:MAG: KamA family radical SAM protein [Phycisphaerae bacterium]
MLVEHPYGDRQVWLSAPADEYTEQTFRTEAQWLIDVVGDCDSLETARERMETALSERYNQAFSSWPSPPSSELIRVRDCMNALWGVLSKRSDARTGFSVARVIWDLAKGFERRELTPGFWAEMIHWIRGLTGQSDQQHLGPEPVSCELSGRQAARERSKELDRLWDEVEERLDQYESGLQPRAVARRTRRREQILREFSATEADWRDWSWQIDNIIDDPDLLKRVIPVTDQELEDIRQARENRLPFAITPYYASLMDETPSRRDLPLRAQVIPPTNYVRHMVRHRKDLDHSCDFMLESDTSPVDLVTRRYPSIVILKPFNTCPQVCVYCQRNWEITEANAPDALVAQEIIDEAIDWIADHDSIREVLITGGDPLMLQTPVLERLLGKLSAIDHVDMIRIGTRMLVTMPMRVTEELAEVLGRFRDPGRRDVAMVTHVEHVYEITPELVQAVDRLRRQGIAVYNQHVYTFFVSRRFEASKLRLILRRCGIDPYYMFAPKGKEETSAYRLPLARMLQEQKEEARLMPGLRRTDEAVFNVPRLGKNHLRAIQHRDLLTVRPDGSRVYEFHPWEKNVTEQETYLATDVPILTYLNRLADELGEDPDEYGSIWYYF